MTISQYSDHYRHFQGAAVEGGGSGGGGSNTKDKLGGGVGWGVGWGKGGIFTVGTMMMGWGGGGRGGMVKHKLQIHPSPQIFTENKCTYNIQERLTKT